jgi:uncharacterized protein
MPVRLLTSSVFKWPDKEVVDKAVRDWAGKVAQEYPEVMRLGYFGSYARGDWGVGMIWTSSLFWKVARNPLT